MKTAVVDVGGGMRGIYAAGVLDYCMDHGITFDLGVGVSAGSANISSFIARQRGRNYPFYTDYPHRKEYMGFHELVHDHSYLNLDYVYGTLSNTGGENPLDFSAFQANPMEFIAVATNAETGEAVYLTKADMRQDDYSVLMASSAMVMYGAGKLKTLAVFPSIFKGEHVRHGEMVEVLTGHNIRVEFDRPTPLQIDGETIPDVTSYEVVS